MVTTDAKMTAVTITLVAHEQGRLSDYELDKLSHVIEHVRTPEDGEDEFN